MDSRERVFATLEHEEPDRVPRDLWATPETVEKLLKYLKLHDAQALWDHFDIDLRYIAGPTYIGPPLKKYPDGSENDIWGVPRIVQHTGAGDKRQSYKSVTRFPLETITSAAELDNYAYWPSPDWFDYSVVYDQGKAVRDQGRIAVFMGDRLNRIAQLKPAMYLRGIDQIFVDMAVEKDIFKGITERLTTFYNEYTMRILDAAKGMIDIICTGDDFGQQHGMLCSLNMWNDMLRPGFEQYIKIIHDGGVKTMHHTCGSMYRLIPEFIACGLDILQALQPKTAEMDYKKIKTEFGDTLSFQGAIGIQDALPFGKPEDVKAEVKNRIEALASGGGYIISTSHNIQGDTCVENIMALFDAYEEYGYYR
jgi:uroporphyrinogen decarboxylase